MTTCDLLWSGPLLSSDREWWYMNFEAMPSIPDITLAIQRHSVQHQTKATPSVIYNWLRSSLLKHLALGVALEWEVCRQLWSMMPVWKMVPSLQIPCNSLNNWNSIPGNRNVKGNRVSVIRGNILFSLKTSQIPVPLSWGWGQVHGRKTLQQTKPVVFWTPWFLSWLMFPRTGALDFNLIYGRKPRWCATSTVALHLQFLNADYSTLCLPWCIVICRSLCQW